MFEKEAEENKPPYACCSFNTGCELWKDGFQKGANFGYNKANEWHYVKNGDLPTKELEEKLLLVRVRNYTQDYIFAYYMLDKYYSKNGKRFYSDIDCDYPIDIDDIIAWKEIVL
jgi:hypothetical protein